MAASVERYDSGEWDDPPGKLGLLYDVERVRELIRGGDPFFPERDCAAFVRFLIDAGCSAAARRRADRPGRVRRTLRDRQRVGGLAGEPAARVLHGRQRLLGLGERPATEVDASRLGGDRDLLAGRGLQPFRFFCAGLTRG